jgi:hypothetical protein
MTIRAVAIRKAFCWVTAAGTVEVWWGVRLPGGARLVGSGAKLVALSGLEFVMAGGEGAAGMQCGVGAFPEVAGNALAAGFDVGDRAAAVPAELGELRLGVPSGAAVGGEFRA